MAIWDKLYYSGLYDCWGWSVPNYNVSTGVFVGRRPIHTPRPTANFAGQADLLSTFKIGATSHKLLLTVDASDYVDRNRDLAMSSTDLAALPDSVRNLNAANPDWSPFDRSLVTQKSSWPYYRYKDIGFLLSERMELLRGRALLYASLRYDDFRGSTRDYLSPSQNNSLTKNVFNETYGGVVHIVPGKLIAFVNRSTTFAPSNTVDRGTGKLQDPPTSRGIEAGARGEILKEAGARRALYWSASIYRIDRKVPQRNPRSRYSDTDDDDYEIIEGEIIPEFLNSGIERADGVEFELFGNVTKQFFISLAYTKLDAYVRKYSDDTNDTGPKREGVRILNVPDERLGATARYSITEGRMRGLNFGLAITYNSEYVARYGMAGSQVTGIDVIDNRLRLNYGPTNVIEEVRPSVTLFDVMASYEFRGDGSHRYGRGRHTIGINIKNLSNLVWYNISGYLNPGRQIYLNYRMRF